MKELSLKVQRGEMWSNGLQQGRRRCVHLQLPDLGAAAAAYSTAFRKKMSGYPPNHSIPVSAK